MLVLVFVAFGIATARPAFAQDTPLDFIRREMERKGKWKPASRDNAFFPSLLGGQRVRTRTYYSYEVPGQAYEIVPQRRQKQRRANTQTGRLRNSLGMATDVASNTGLIDLNGNFLSGSGIELGGQQSYCVRLCDGFFFPVGTPDQSADIDAHALSCQSQCPTAETRLFVAPAGSDGIESATSKGKLYSKLPTAYLYRTKVSKACSCNAKGYGTSRLAVINDFTMRNGDVVMTSDGLKAFAGTRRYPFKEANFVPATWSKALSARERDGMRGLEDGGRNSKFRKEDIRRQREVDALVGHSDVVDISPDAPTSPDALVRYIGANPSTNQSTSNKTAQSLACADGAKPGTAGCSNLQ